MNISKLPESIQIQIYEYNVDHRKQYNETLRKIEQTFVNRRISEIIKESDSYDNFLSIENIIYEKIDEPELFVKVLSRCDCCARHTLRRPSSINNLNGTPPYGVFFNKKPITHKCQCNCRNMSRNICRVFGYVPFDEIFGTEFDGEEE